MEPDMQPRAKEPALIWHEDSAIWEIVAGELIIQNTDAISGDPAGLMRQAREHALDAVELLARGDKDAAGHTLIGCALALGLAARSQSEDHSPIGNYGSEFAAAISWQAIEPSIDDIERLRSLLDGSPDQPSGGVPTRWEVAVRAGAYAAGLSPYITRRRGRRDLIEANGAPFPT
jgi:hypothetical protein